MSNARATKLVIACGDYDHTRPLVEGAVPIGNCSAEFVKLAPGEMLTRSFEDPAFNVSELSVSNYVTRRIRGDCPYVAIPVYTARSFRHADLYARTDRGIETPRDLRGRRVGIEEYQRTAGVWTRGLLEDEYQVRSQDVQWVSVSLDAPAPGATAFVPPPGVSIEQVTTGQTLSDLLEAGEIDAVLAPRVPACYTRGVPQVRRLYGDPAAAEDDYFRRTGIFPIIHIMGIRNNLVEREPQLPGQVFRAFVAARNLAFRGTAEPQAAAAGAARGPAFDKRYFTYGLNERDRKTLNAFLGYHLRQGLSARRYEIEQLFAPVPLSSYGA